MNSFTSAINSMKRNFTMSSASILLVTLTLLVVGFVFVVSFNTAKLTESVFDSLKVYAYVEHTASEEESKAIRSKIEQIDGVEEINFSTKEEELASLLEMMGDSAKGMDETFSDDSNPLEDVYIVTIDLDNYDLDAISKEVGKIKNVDSVDYGESTTNDFIAMMKLVKNASLFVALVLVFISLFIITNTIKLTITARRTEIEIMRLVGATKWFIRLPFVVEGMIIGILGGIISFVALHFFYVQAFNSDALVIIRTSLMSPTVMDEILILTLPVIGVIIGCIGSIAAMRRYLTT